MHQLRWVLAGLCAAATLTCGDGSGPVGTTSYNIAGGWYWEESLQDNALGVFCFDSGGTTVHQDGASFSAAGTQTGYCTVGSNSAPFSEPFTINSGTLAGSAVNFVIGGCPYGGTVHGTTPDSLTGTVLCTMTEQGTTVHLSGPWRLRRDRPDRFPPQVQGSVNGSSLPAFFFLGDTLQIAVTATDERRLHSVGYRLSGAVHSADSLPLDSVTSIAHTFKVPVTAAIVGTSDLTVFARDLENLSQSDLDSVRILPVHARTPRTVALPSSVRDLVYDPQRGRLYLSMFGSAQVAVLDPATASLGTAITLPGNPEGIDLSVSGDSLLAALSNRGSFAVVNLVSSAIDTVHIAFDTTLYHDPGALRVAQNGIALVTGASTQGISGIGGQVVSVNLATKAQTRRLDVGSSGAIAIGSVLVRSGDRSRVVLLQTPACCPVAGQVYLASSGAFGAATGTFSYFTRSVSASTTGNLFLFYKFLFTGDLAAADSVSDPAAGGADPTVLAPDGSRAYLATSFGQFPGFVSRRVSDNAELERDYVVGWIPGIVDSFALLPNGLTLIAYTGIGSQPPVATTMYLIDLQ